MLSRNLLKHLIVILLGAGWVACSGSESQDSADMHVDTEVGGDNDVHSNGDADGGSGCGSWECTGEDCYDLIAMPGSYDPVSAEAQAAGYYIATEPRYAFVRKDIATHIQWATCEMVRAHPGIAPLALHDMTQEDGQTPGTDDEMPRHPGGWAGQNVACAYYQTDGDNDMTNICGDGTDSPLCGTEGTYNDGLGCTTETHVVDIDQQGEFLALMALNPLFRVMGVADVIGPELEGEGHPVAYGEGWVCMHLLVELSFSEP